MYGRAKRGFDSFSVKRKNGSGFGDACARSLELRRDEGFAGGGERQNAVLYKARGRSVASLRRDT